ncbi:MAG: mismatch repair protein MutS [Bacillota bacterium]|jgi:DNA mismatch repair protein MutS
MKKTSAPYTPMMMQYLQIKSQYPDTLIFFRLGDFYELFFEDAKVASRELSLVLTGKSAGQEERVPMCGIPFHAYKGYVKKLIDKGYKVGIVEQMEDASVAKGLVQRDVTQIYTPGSFIDDQQTAHNFLVAVHEDPHCYWIIFGDISTGEVFSDFIEKQPNILMGYLQKLSTHEVVMNRLTSTLIQEPIQTLGMSIVILELDQDSQSPEQYAYQLWLNYVQSILKKSVPFLRPFIPIYQDKILKMDAVSLSNLEVLESLKQKTVQGSLYWVLDQTNTPMGSRLLKQWLMRPSAHLPTIVMRHQMVKSFLDQFLTLESIREILKSIYDIPRIISKLHLKQLNARDLISLKKSLEPIHDVKKLLTSFPDTLSQSLASSIQVFPQLIELINQGIQDEPPVSIKDGGLIKVGFNAELDHWMSLAKGGKKALIELELKERERTGIKNLKVGYNQVFGYFIEISNGQLSAIKPEFEYERRQTLANGERFINRPLKALESQLLQAEEMQKKLEESIFQNVVEKIEPFTHDLQILAQKLSELDVLSTFANVSRTYQFVQPTFTEDKAFNIQQSRHPVIEKALKKSVFVANDFEMDSHTNTLLITGPNMGGKSTYMRQIALLMIMAQIGCFVPAKSANLMWLDAIYTRIGASDDLMGGQSTFMMEMTQTEFALSHASERTLLIFDEIGRGTATYDGMALAQSIIEYATSQLKAKTLFSTHYHELTQLEKSLPQLKNIHVAVHEENDTITFLYQVKPGSMSQSFGIHVAQLAQLPPSLIQRAKTILSTLEKSPPIAVKPIQENKHPLVKALQDIDPLTLSPMEALQVLIALKKNYR